ncbi:MAG: hypothetical protein O6829_07575 [Alphaproteobacteria bacterium]|nr:hypothetical protein [Alphaproteobacteria bacterium]
MTKTLVAALAVVLVAGCGVVDEYVRLLGQPDTTPHTTTFTPSGRAITTYHYNEPRDPLGSVHQYRPDIYYRMFPR